MEQTFSPGTVAEVIYQGGDIITMNCAAPTAEALAVKDGRILAVGSKEEVLKTRGSTTIIVDLGGKALLPGFLDAHSHFNNALQIVGWANVSPPPVGPVTDIPGLIAAVKAHADRMKPEKGDWIIAYGYDANELHEKRDVTINDLDPVFPDNPLMLIHVSNHGAVLNSAGLAKAGVTEKTETPAGGIIARLPGSNRPAGLLMETAFLPIFANMPQPAEEEKFANFKQAQLEYARNGYTTIQEGATNYADFVTIRKAAEKNLLFLDLVVLPMVTDLRQFSGENLTNPAYHHRLKLGGVKLFGDGSPQGKTAYWSKPLLTGGPGGELAWCGEPTFPYETFAKMVAAVHATGARIYCHCNGDGAIDNLIKAFDEIGVKADQDRRDVVVHSQFVRDDQLDRYVEIGLTPSFFTNHVFFWGEVHVQNTGEERASFISPMAASKARGISFSNHTDFSVTPLDPFMTIWTAITRQTRSGRVLGPDQRVDVLTALKALTLDAAWQYREEKTKGSLEACKLADFVIVDKNPCKVKPDDVRNLKVVETIKEGRSVYRREEQ
ncbi:imidazolonepropionase [Methanosarcina siciliae C2J]|uniref:Imidazolonepropionase n=1 Tax=Methanosarcina siciliae C2J TaxID=1434118 RepID=A0A0E3PLI1_9EURY|nr:amidohydrolase [Methanosarcina siciliae]AKB35290.1 imidazolonepropionase [Methanosarcina siciliae C2J]